MKTSLKFFILASVTAVLSACGGGGGSNDAGAASPAPAPAPAATSAATLVTPAITTPPTPAGTSTVVVIAAASTYPAGGEQASVFELLNTERNRCGFGLLTQSAQLDQSATAHANYLTTNNLAYGHDEAAGLPFFTGAREADRAIAAGYTNPVGASLGTFSGPAGVVGQLRTPKQLRSLLGAPYHLLSLLEGYADIGIGYSQTQTPVTPVGTATLEKNALNITLGRRAGANDLATDQIATYPCQGTTGVNPNLADETPSPVPANLTQDFKRYGTPIAVRVRAGKVMNLTSVTITPAAGGAAVQAVIVNLANDPNRGAFMRADSAYVLPLAPLQAGGTYTVNLAGTSDGAAFTKSFSFTTGQ